MLNRQEIQGLLDNKEKVKVFDSDGEKIGTLGQIYLDDESGTPNFATVHTGLFGMAENFVPLNEAEVSEGALYVRYPKELVKDAPNLDPAAHISEAEEDQLYRYYAQAGVGNTEPVAAPELSETTSPFTAGERLARNDVGSVRPRLRKYMHLEQGSDQGEPVDAQVSGLNAAPLVQAAAGPGNEVEGRSVDPHAGWSSKAAAPEVDDNATSQAPDSHRFGGSDGSDP